MRIERLEPSRHVKGRFLVHLENGALLKVTEREILSFSLYTGMELDGETVKSLSEAGRESSAKSRAAAMVGARPLSRQELVRRLEEKGEDPEHAQTAADWLEELGALDDAAYGRSVARHYAAKGYGPRKIQDELYRRGVPRELWEKALAQIEDNSESLDAFLEKKLRGSHDPRDVKKASDALVRRGFSWSEISDALRRYGMEVWD